MTDPLWTAQDFEQMKTLGISPSEAERQWRLFKNPPPFLQLDRPASTGDGIFQLNDNQIQQSIKAYERALEEGRLLKFVPASGAASRMFHLLVQFSQRPSLSRSNLKKEAAEQEESRQVLHFMEFLPQMALWEPLAETLKGKGKNLEALWRAGEDLEILRALLSAEGLDYGQKPKGLVHFHSYPSEKRTPLEEHLVEGVHTVRDGKGESRIHFTISREHEGQFREHLQWVQGKHEKRHGTKFRIEFSFQKESTNTLAVDQDNVPFRGKDGRLVFRAGGHGALIENLNDLQGDLILIKNIDNVAAEPHLKTSLLWKKILAGFLALTQQKIFSHLKTLKAGPVSGGYLNELTGFARGGLGLDLGPGFDFLSADEKTGVLENKLNRPIRVCGVVPNTGEPGGGPFWVHGKNGELSLQIVEGAQVDMKSPDQKGVFEKSSHFNPVDLACGVRSWNGELFDLKRYSDPEAVFISRKSQEGRELKALELPGLWNGAMADWITLFVEVPLETFNPVKTIFDLLKPTHQA